MAEPEDTGQVRQRITVALTGLAAVGGLIALASIITGAASRERPVAAPGAPRAEVVANLSLANDSDPGEPLAELGVAPSTQANAAAPTGGH